MEERIEDGRKGAAGERYKLWEGVVSYKKKHEKNGAGWTEGKLLQEG